MAYIVNKSDGSVLATVPDGSVNTTSSSITLIGKNYAGYGEAINENFVRMLENFSAAAAPTSPQTGQLWWDNQTKVLKVYDAGNWKRAGGATSSATAPTGSTVIGDFWWDTTNSQLNIYDGSQFILVGPQGGGTAGESGSIVTTITDSLNVEHVVVRIAINDTTVAYYSKDAEFVPASAISGFASIKPGLNFSTAISGNRVTGNLTGNVTSTGVNTFGSASVTAATASTSTGTGALTVTGGAGIGGRLNVGGNVAITSGTAASSTTVGALTVSGGVGITGSQYVGGNALVTGNVGIETTSPTTKLDIFGPSGISSFTGTSWLGVRVRGAASTNDYSGIDFSTQGQSVPTARIGAVFSGTGSSLQFGTSGNYNNGITNTAMTIGSTGDIGIGTSTLPAATRLSVVGGAVQLSGGNSAQAGIRIQEITGSASITGINNDNNSFNPIVFYASGTEAMRINTNDRVGIGTQSPGYKLDVTGDIRATGDIIAFSTSDSRLKTDLHQITNALEKVSALNGFEFSWNDAAKEIYPERTARDVGVIAQEVQAVLPEVVTERADGYLAVQYEKLVPLLIEAIKELKSQVQELQSRVQ
jgi:hypothetical protein